MVGVLKDKRDLNILLTRNWYRIPVAYMPVRKFSWLAFYQPAALFGRQGKCIQYYGRVLKRQTIKRNDLLPQEANHPRADDYYFQVRLGKIRKLARPIRNIIPRRVSFGFTSLDSLLKSKNILELYGVPPTEEIVERALKQASIKAISQHYISENKKRYRVDFALFCKNGKIAIECDNKKAHSSRLQRKKDKIKNNFLKYHGWTVVRLPEANIISDLASCILRIERGIRQLGGLTNDSK